MKIKLLAFVLSMSLVLSLAGCRNAHPEEKEAGAAEPQITEDAQASAEDDGQNPVMNFVGIYGTDYSTEALVEAEGMENAKITVTYAGSPWFHHQTVMSGRFDPETLTVEFSNAALTEYAYNSDGSVAEEKVSYEDGTGRAVFSPADNTLTITEEFPSGDSETVYRWGPASDMKYVSDPDHYASVTAMDKAEVETVVGFNVRTAYLSENWYALADMIRYPITINGTELADADAFLGYMIDKTVSESDRQAMMDEDFLDMFVNGQGICMGSGQIWLNDPNYMTDQEPVLQIIAISGIVSADESETPAADTGRQDGERFEEVIVLEGMEETVRYEHVRNDTLGFEMDYDYELLARQTDSVCDRFVSIWDDPEDPQNYLEVQYSAADAETIAASVSESLSDDYEILREACTLDRAGSCLRIDASEVKGGGYTADQMQTVYIIPTDDGCRIATAHYYAENAEGFGRRLSYMMNTFKVIDRSADFADSTNYDGQTGENSGGWTGADFGERIDEDFDGWTGADFGERPPEDLGEWTGADFGERIDEDFDGWTGADFGERPPEDLGD